ncbi:MAG: phospholipase D family protein [Paracoccaceae bacterium]
MARTKDADADGARATPDPRLLVTAQEAFPAFERAVLDARSRIDMGFRVFDPTTRLRSDEGRAVGETWFDLIADALRRGVRVRLILSDFDPVIREPLHAATWSTMRWLRGAAEASGRPELLHLEAAMHDARVGWLPRVLLWPIIRREANRHLADLPRGPERRRALAERPGLRALLTEGDRVRLWPPHALVPATHHQKIAVIDDEVLYVGGLDLDERRWDDLAHRRAADRTWYDLQVLSRDASLARRARAHLDGFRAINAGGPDRVGRAPGLIRTVSGKRDRGLFHLSPAHRVEEILQATLAGIERSRDLIYVENQFLRDTRVTAALCRRARLHPALAMIAVLPAAPEEAAFFRPIRSDVRYGEFMQVRALRRLRRAFGPRLVVLSPARTARPRPDEDGRAVLEGAPIIYVHAKLSIFDRQGVTISSANLNGRSMSWDTESGLALEDADQAVGMLARCAAHWRMPDASRAAGSGLAVAGAWRAQAFADVRRPPEDRAGLLVPYALDVAQMDAQPLPGIPQEMV